MKTKVIKFIIVGVIIAAISVGLFILSRFIDFRALIASAGNWSIVVYLLLYITCTILLCFVPGTSMTFITIAVLLFGANWQTFLICSSGLGVAVDGADDLGKGSVDEFLGVALVVAKAAREGQKTGLVFALKAADPFFSVGA